jgi:hypothetical protein
MDKAVFQSERDVGGKLKLPGECLKDREDFAEEAVPGEESSQGGRLLDY